MTLRWTHFLKFLRWENVSKRENKYLKLARRVKNEILEEYENENYYLVCDRTCGTFLAIASVSRTKIIRSHGPITFWMFSTVLHLLVSLSYRCVLHCFLTMPLGFNSSLKSVASKLLLFTNDPFSKLSGHFECTLVFNWVLFLEEATFSLKKILWIIAVISDTT